MSTPRNLNDLPNELVGIIEDQLEASDKSRFHRTCHRFYKLNLNHYSLRFFPAGYDRRQREYLYGMKHPHIYQAKQELFQLLQHVIDGEKTEAEGIIKQDPGLLLEVGRVTDYAGRRVEGTALRIALGARDVAVDGCCMLVTIDLPERASATKDVVRKALNELPSIPTSTGYIRCRDKLFYNSQYDIDEFIDIKLDENALKQFDILMIPSKKIRMLTKFKKIQIAKITGHYHDEEMAEMIMRYLRQLPDGEAKIATQINEQFPPGWEIEEEYRVKRDANKLMHVIDCIVKSETLEECMKDIKYFAAYLADENQRKGIIKMGYHFNEELFFEALRLLNETLKKFPPKAIFREDSFFDMIYNYRTKLIWCLIFGRIERHVTACLAQAICMDFGYGRISRLTRSLVVDSDGFKFFPLDSNPKFILGEGHAYFGDRGLIAHCPLSITKEVENVSTYMNQKKSTLQHLISQEDWFEESQPYFKNSCTIM